MRKMLFATLVLGIMCSYTATAQSGCPCPGSSFVFHFGSQQFPITGNTIHLVWECATPAPMSISNACGESAPAVACIAPDTTIPDGDCVDDLLCCFRAVICGIEVSTWVLIDRQDTTPPIANGCGQDTIILGCISNPLGVALQPAYDLCSGYDQGCESGPIEADLIDSLVTLTALPCGQMVTKPYSYTDNCGNETIVTQRIIFTDNEAPTLHGVPGNVSVECGQIPPVPTVTATDNCNGPVPVDFVEVQNGSGCNYKLKRTWTATDDCGNVATKSQVITVNDYTDPVLVGVPTDTIYSYCGQAPILPNVTAMDNCDTSPVVTAAKNLPFNCYGGLGTVVYWAQDQCGNISQADTVWFRIYPDKTAPAWTSALPADLTLACGTPLPTVPTLTATDNCGIPMVTYSQTGSGPACGRVYTRKWVAKDACWNMVTHIQKITMVDTVPPVLIGVSADVHVQCGSTPTAPTVTATDNCDNSVPVYLNVTNVTNACGWTKTRTWTATDDCGNTATAVQVITFADTEAPTVVSGTVANDTTVYCSGAFVPQTPQFVDNCTATLTIQADVFVTGSNPVLTTYTWTAIDACNNATTATTTVTSVTVGGGTINLPDVEVCAGSIYNGVVITTDTLLVTTGDDQNGCPVDTQQLVIVHIPTVDTIFHYGTSCVPKPDVVMTMLSADWPGCRDTLRHIWHWTTVPVPDQYVSTETCDWSLVGTTIHTPATTPAGCPYTIHTTYTWLGDGGILILPELTVCAGAIVQWAGNDIVINHDTILVDTIPYPGGCYQILQQSYQVMTPVEIHLCLLTCNLLLVDSVLIEEFGCDSTVVTTFAWIENYETIQQDTCIDGVLPQTDTVQIGDCTKIVTTEFVFDPNEATRDSVVCTAQPPLVLEELDSNGCVTNVAINWIVLPPCGSQIDSTICQGDTLAFGDQLLIVGGIYTDTLTSSAGCDSVVVLFLTVRSAPLVALFAAQPTCDDTLGVVGIETLGQPITWHWSTGISGDSITPGAGTYWVTIVDDLGCTATDSLTLFAPIGCDTIPEPPVDTTDRCKVKIYPNPAVLGQTAYVEISGVQGTVAIKIHDMLGKRAWKHETNNLNIVTTLVEIPNLPSGLYVVSFDIPELPKKRQKFTRQFVVIGQ